MKATESATIVALYGDMPKQPLQKVIQRNLDTLHVQFAKQAHEEVMHSLLTKGRATGPCKYDTYAACAVMEDLVFSDATATLSLIDLAAAWADPKTSDYELAQLTRAMFKAALTISSEKLADQCDEGQVANRFHPGKGDEQP